jgi:exonuclease SbcC
MYDKLTLNNIGKFVGIREFTFQPGLNLLIGRNGSGKSTFIGALATVLSGDPKYFGKKTHVYPYGVKPEVCYIELKLKTGYSLVYDFLATKAHYGVFEDNVLTVDEVLSQLKLQKFSQLNLILQNEFMDWIEGGPKKRYDNLIKMLNIQSLTNIVTTLQQSTSSALEENMKILISYSEKIKSFCNDLHQRTNKLKKILPLCCSQDELNQLKTIYEKVNYFVKSKRELKSKTLPLIKKTEKEIADLELLIQQNEQLITAYNFEENLEKIEYEINVLKKLKIVKQIRSKEEEIEQLSLQIQAIPKLIDRVYGIIVDNLEKFQSYKPILDKYKERLNSLEKYYTICLTKLGMIKNKEKSCYVCGSEIDLSKENEDKLVEETKTYRAEIEKIKEQLNLALNWEKDVQLILEKNESLMGQIKRIMSDIKILEDTIKSENLSTVHVDESLLNKDLDINREYLRLVSERDKLIKLKMEHLTNKTQLQEQLKSKKILLEKQQELLKTFDMTVTTEELKQYKKAKRIFSNKDDTTLNKEDCESRISLLTAMQNEMEAFVKDVENLKNKVEDIKIVKRIFSKDGLLKIFLSIAVSNLISKVNSYLHLLGSNFYIESFIDEDNNWDLYGNFGIENFSIPVNRLSFGQKNLVFLLTKLVIFELFDQAKILVMDEPIQGIDEQNSEAIAHILKIISTIIKERGGITVISSHNPDLIEDYDNVINLDT